MDFQLVTLGRLKDSSEHYLARMQLDVIACPTVLDQLMLQSLAKSLSENAMK